MILYLYFINFVMPYGKNMAKFSHMAFANFAIWANGKKLAIGKNFARKTFLILYM